MTQKNTAAAALSSPVRPPFYSTDVHSALDAQPVTMACLPPTATAYSNIEEKSVCNDSNSFLITNLRQSPVVIEGDKTELKRSQPREKEKSLAGGDNCMFLGRSAQFSLQRAQTDERESARNLATPKGRFCSAGTQLLSPLPSPLAKNKNRTQSMNGNASFFRASPLLPPSAHQGSGSSDVDSLQLVGHPLLSLSPHGCLISPVQHNLVYNDNKRTQHQRTTVRRKSGDFYSDEFSSKRHGSFSQHIHAPSALLRQEEARLRFLPAVDDDLQLPSYTCRMSPTSLQFSPPRDEKNSFSSASSLVAEGLGCITNQSFSKGTIYPLLTKKKALSMRRVNEGYMMTPEDGSFADAKAKRGYLTKRCRSAPSGVKARPANSLSGNYQCSHSLRAGNRTCSGDSNLRSLTPAKEILLKKLDELRLRNEELALIELEGKDRRDIIGEFIKGVRELMVIFAFGHMTIMGHSTETQLSSLKTNEGSHVPIAKAASAENNNGKKTANSGVMKRGQCSDVLTTAGEKQTKKNLKGGSFIEQSVNWQELQEEKNVDGEKRIDDHANISVGSRESLQVDLFSFGHLKSSKRKDKSNVQNTESFFQSQLLYILSEEYKHRENIFDECNASFHFLFCYDRIIEGALQPSVIILQESCQWQSILIEATNELRRLQDSQLDIEFSQGIQQARDKAKSLMELVKKETRERLGMLQQEETLERQKILRLFNNDLAVVVGQRVFGFEGHTPGQEVKIELDDVLFEEMTARNGLLKSEIYQRNALCSKYENVVGFRSNKTTALRFSSNSSNNKKIAMENNTLIDVSYIASADENQLHIGNMELPLPTVQFTKEIGLSSLPFIFTYENSSTKSNFQDSFMDVTGDGAFNTRCDFFECNSTSNTLPTKATNTTTGTTSGIVGGQYSAYKNQVFCNAGKQQVILCSSSLSPLAANSQAELCSTTDQVDDNSQNSADSYDPMHVKKKGSSNSEVIRHSNSILLPAYDLSQKDYFGDVNVVVNACSFDTTQKRETDSVKMLNCHLVPCSLKKILPCSNKKKIAGAGTVFAGQQNVKQLRSASFSNKLTQSTKRPYNDDIIFDTAAHNCCTTAVADATSMMNKQSMGIVTTPHTCGFNLLPNQKTTEPDIKDLVECTKRGNGKGENEETAETDENGHLTFDTIEAVESIDDWSRTVTNDEYVICGDDDGQSLSSPSFHSDNNTSNAYLDDVGVKQEELKSCSVGLTQPDINTVPEFTLSTMLETTAAMTFDNDDAESQLMKTREEKKNLLFSNDDNVDTGSFLPSRESNVSESTVPNECPIVECAGDNVSVSNAKSAASDFSRMSFLSDSEFIDNSEKCASSFMHDYPFNYMRPTISWLRQHEELEWHPTRRVLRGCGSGVLANDNKKNSNNAISNLQDRCCNNVDRSFCNKSFEKHHVTRLPFEDGPGVWMEAGMKRRAFGFDVSGNKAHEACDDFGQQAIVNTKICSPNRRRDACYRFLSEGSARPSPFRTRRSATPGSIDAAPNADATVLKKEGVKKCAFAETHATLEALCGVLERRSSSRSPVNYAKKSLSVRPPAMTPSYLDAFYKLDHNVAERRRFLAALRHGPVLCDLATQSAAGTTPHRLHRQHRQRHNQNKDCRTFDMGSSCGTISRRFMSPHPKPWR